MDADERKGAGVETFDQAFPALFRRARGLAYRILGDLPAAEDAAAEALARTLVHWDRVGGLEHRDGWVLRVTTNVALDVARRRARRGTVPLHSADGSPSPDAVDSPEELVVLRAALVEALSALPRRQREAIVLIHLVGLSPTEAAASMRVSISSVGQHVRRGLDRLRELSAEVPFTPIDLRSELT